MADMPGDPAQDSRLVEDHQFHPFCLYGSHMTISIPCLGTPGKFRSKGDRPGRGGL
jgi:hypothetical protein